MDSEFPMTSQEEERRRGACNNINLNSGQDVDRIQLLLHKHNPHRAYIVQVGGNNTYGLCWTVQFWLSVHCKSVMRFISGTSGTHVNIICLPTGYFCTDCRGIMFKLRRASCPLAASGMVQEEMETRGFQLNAFIVIQELIAFDAEMVH